MALIEEQMAYPIHLELQYVLGQYEGADLLLTLFGVGTPGSADYKALMPLDTIPGPALFD